MEKEILEGNHEAVKHFLNNSGKTPATPMLSKKDLENFLELYFFWTIMKMIVISNNTRKSLLKT